MLVGGTERLNNEKAGVCCNAPTIVWLCFLALRPASSVAYFPAFVVGYMVLVCIYLWAFYRLLGEYKKYVLSPPVRLLTSKKVQQVLHQSNYDPVVVKRIREKKAWRLAVIVYFGIGVLFLCVFAFWF